jgi:hypothetical protein
LDPSGFTLLCSNIPDTGKTHSEIQRLIGRWRYLMRGLKIAAVSEQNGFEKYFGGSPSIVLVRPDGYVAFTGTDTSTAKLAEYCDQWLLAQTSSTKMEALHG